MVLSVGNFWMGRDFIIAHGGFNCIYSLMMCGAALAFIWLPDMQINSRRFWRAASIVIVGGFIASFSFSARPCMLADVTTTGLRACACLGVRLSCW